MSVAVKLRRTEKSPESVCRGVVLRFRPKTPAHIIKHIEREYGNYLVDGDDELVVWEETDLARRIDARMTPGKYLRILREAQGMTQQDISDKTGHRPSYISDMETGQRAISRMTAKKLAVIFNVSPAVFI
jgi:DNA-binding XRE family transcriptional regulator